MWDGEISDALTGFVAGIIIGAIIAGMFFGDANAVDTDQRGLAEYCAADGRVAFKGECGK